MKESIYDSCLLYSNKNVFEMIKLQTHDILMLANKTFAEIKDKELEKARITFKLRKILIVFISLKFNEDYVKLVHSTLKNVQSIMKIHLNQQNQIKYVQFVSIKNVKLQRSKDKVIINVSIKNQYVTQELGMHT